MPQEQYQQGKQNIDANAANALAGAQDRRGGLGMIGKIQQGSNNATLNLDALNAKARQQNQLRLAGYQDKQWQINQNQPYQRNYNYGMQLLGAGNQNEAGALDTLGSTIGNAAYRGAFGSFGSGMDGKGGYGNPYQVGADAYKMPRLPKWQEGINS